MTKHKGALIFVAFSIAASLFVVFKDQYFQSNIKDMSESKQGFSLLSRHSLLLLIPLVFFGLRWVKLDYDVTGFILASTKKLNIKEHPYPIKVIDQSGYDGLRYYHIALKPYQTKEQELGLDTDLAYRKQRILYPLVSNHIVLGQPLLVPYGMVLVNIIAFMCYILGVIKLRLLFHWTYRETTIFLLIPALYIGMARNLAEVMSSALLIWILYFYQVERKRLVMVLSVLLLFTREESMLITGPILGLWAVEALKRKSYLISILYTLPFLIFLLWKWYLIETYGEHMSVLTGMPFKGLIEGMKLNFSKNFRAGQGWVNHIFPFYCLGLLSWIYITVVLSLKVYFSHKIKSHLPLALGCMMWILFLSFLPDQVYEEEISFARILSSLAILSLFIICTRQKIGKIYFMISCLILVPTVIRLLVFL